MPCIKCKKTILIGKNCGCRVRYCYCGACNHCHITGICPDGKFWYSRKVKGKKDNRASFICGQSHGGHSFVPGCNKH